MNKILKVLLPMVLLLFAICVITSCKKEIPKEPTEVQADFWKLTWNGHPDATEFVVEISGQEYRTTETEFLMFDYIAPSKTAQIRVKAVFENDADTSEWVEITYTAEDVTEGLVYEKNDDNFDFNSGYTVYLPADKIPENGELVIPDTYEGEFVVEFRSETIKFVMRPGVSLNKASSEYDGVSYTGITKVRLPKELSVIQGGALYDASMTEIYLPSTVTEIRNSAFESCDKLKKINLPDSLTMIYDFAFADCTVLTDVILPKNLTGLGVGAFQSTAITEINIPEKVTCLFENAFNNCTCLSEISFSDILEEIRPGAFDNTAWYNSQPDGMLILHNRLYGYKGEMPENTTLVIPSTVTRFAGRKTFYGQKNLVSITIPGSIRENTLLCFSGCENLREVNLSEGMDAIKAGAFENTGIKQLTVPSGVTRMGGKAFMNCTKLTMVRIPNDSKLKEISGGCFYGCESLSEINIPEGTEEVYGEVFTGCTSLTSLTIPDSVTKFDMNSICYTGITHFVWPKNVGFIYFYEPDYKYGMPLNYLVIQKGTAYLQYAQFFLYDNLDTFYFEGTEEEFKEIEIDRSKATEKWESNLKIYYYSETEPTEEGNFWHYVDGKPVKW